VHERESLLYVYDVAELKMYVIASKGFSFYLHKSEKQDDLLSGCINNVQLIKYYVL